MAIGQPKLLSQTIQKTMNKKNFQQNILQEVNMDASAIFMANGDITFIPCPWESEKEVTLGGEKVHYKGGIEVDVDGRTRVKRVNVGSMGPKYEMVYETPHGKVMVTHKRKRPNPEREKVIVKFEFPKKFGLTLTRALYAEEHEQVMSFLKTRKELTEDAQNAENI